MEVSRQIVDRERTEVNVVLVSPVPKQDVPAAWRDCREWRGMARADLACRSCGTGRSKTLPASLGISDAACDEHFMHEFGITPLAAGGNMRRTRSTSASMQVGFLPAGTNGTSRRSDSDPVRVAAS